MLRTFKAKLITLILLGSIAAFGLAGATGEGLNISKKFKPGDIISADVLNELFATVSRIVSPPDMSDLVGTWQCTKVMIYSAGYDTMFQHYQTPDANGLWRTLQVPLVIADGGNGKYTWDSGSTYNAFNYGGDGDACAGHGKISLYGGKLAITWPRCGSFPDLTDIFKVRRLSDTRIEIDAGGGGGGGGINSVLLICDKQNIPPVSPSDVAANETNKTVTLTWNDNSSTETGFKILRKDNLTDDFVAIATSQANSTTYQDTVSKSGSYWYRVKATNVYGDSDGSNVVLVEVK